MASGDLSVAPASIARSSTSAGKTSIASAAPASTARRLSLREARINGCSASHKRPRTIRMGQGAGVRRRSASRLSTAAAVSSIERRVTSIAGQLCLAQSRRENATSSATALRSIYS